ncbi:pirin family protein [Cohnella endophytica]|uniref:Pirin family protein n=1 Tax=Cohnella endophytica TaxID=2419778 RepID=A0A494Y2F7_9BACL|nr:pirin family protein [Cohnella endophytica]RKP56180.1 pirin family protein [Cohnella endophytica]
MISIQRADERYSADHGWLKSNFSFSFADYYDPKYMQFGPMRVLNDDSIAASEGFGMHPHREMEIVTLVLNGVLEHKDSLGNRAVTSWGGIQRMSAGTGVFHSEYNISPDEQLDLLQMWFMPNVKGVEPSYETTEFDTNGLKDRWVPIVSSNGVEGKVASLHQDMSMYLSEPSAGKTITYKQLAGRKAFLFVLEGEVGVNGEVVLGRRDAARIEDVPELTIASAGGARILLIDLP